MSVVALTAGAIAGFVTLVAGREPGVSAGRFAVGIVLAVALLGVIPAMAYALLGFKLAGRRGWLAIAWIVSIPPLFICGFIAIVAVAKMTDCTPGESNCPISFSSSPSADGSSASVR